jgi:hypothetical protein
MAALVAGGCDRTGQISESTRLLVDSAPDVPSVTYIAYTHAGRTDTLWAGGTGSVVEETTEIYLDLGGGTDEASLREHVRVEPRGVLDGEVRWSEYRQKGFIRLHRLAPGREVYLTVRAGLPRGDDDPLPHDQVWRLVREEGTRVELAVRGPGILLFEGGRYRAADEAVLADEAVVAVQPDTFELELSFSRAMNREGVEARLRAELESARSLAFDWADSVRLSVSVVLPDPTGGLVPGWDRHYLELAGLTDARGLPNVEPRQVVIDVGNRAAFHRWDAEEGVRVLAEAPPRLVVLSPVRTVSPAGVLVWHFEEEVGDYWGVAPWIVDPETGDYRALGGSQAAFEALSMAWLPTGDRAAVGDIGAVRLIEPDATVRARYSLGDSVNVLQFAVNPADGRLAVITLPQLAIDDEIPASVVVIAPDGQVTDHVAAVGVMEFPESSPESLWPHWLPDGRLAFLHLPPGAWLDGNGSARTIAFVDFERGAVEQTGAAATAIRDVMPDGRLLLEGNRTYDPSSNELRVIQVPVSGLELTAVSPDGEWIAGSLNATGEVGVLSLPDRRWEVVGRGTLIGWSPGGALNWIGVVEQE